MNGENRAFKRKRTLIGIIAAVVCLILAAVIAIPVVFSLVSVQAEYEKAVRLVEKESYEKAYEAFKALGNYKDSKEYLSRFRIVYDKEEFLGKDGLNRVTEYTFNNKGQVLTEIERDVKSGRVVSSYECKYDKDGRVLSEESKTLYGDSQRKYVYAYDKNGNRISYKFISVIDGVKDENEWFYEYDGRGNMIRYRGVSVLSEHKYDDKNRVIETVGYSEDGTPSITKKYSYDKNGNVKKYELFESDGRLRWREEYTYNSMGQKLETKKYLKDGTVSEQVNCVYDKKGNLLKKTTEKFNEIVCEEREYDTNENLTSYRMWIKEVGNHEDGEYVLHSERKYTYDEKGNCLKAYTMSFDENYGIFESTEKMEYDDRGNVIRTEYDGGYSEYKYYGKRHIVYIAADSHLMIG